MRSIPCYILFSSIYLTIIRSLGQCGQIEEALSLASSILQTETETKTLYKYYAAQIEVCCHADRAEQALQLLHTMATLTSPPTPIPRSCYLLLFNSFSRKNWMADRAAGKKTLQEM